MDAAEPPQGGEVTRRTGTEVEGTTGDVTDQDAAWTSYRPTPLLDAALDKAVTIPSAVVRAHVDALRRRNPEASPTRIIRLLEREYLLVVSSAGGAVGVAAAFPSVGTGIGIALTSSDIATFFASSAAFALAVADVHGIAVDDVARRRALLLATVLGEKGARDVEKALGGSSFAWGKVLLTSMPSGTLTKVNKGLTNRFVRTQVAKQGGLAIGRLLPFGVGAVIGVTGGRALGQGVVGQSRRAFGPPPSTFGRIVEVVESPDPATAPQLFPVPDEVPDDAPSRRARIGRFRRRPAADTVKGTAPARADAFTDDADDAAVRVGAAPADEPDPTDTADEHHANASQDITEQNITEQGIAAQGIAERDGVAAEDGPVVDAPDSEGPEATRRSRRPRLPRLRRRPRG